MPILPGLASHDRGLSSFTAPPHVQHLLLTDPIILLTTDALSAAAHRAFVADSLATALDPPTGSTWAQLAPSRHGRWIEGAAGVPRCAKGAGWDVVGLTADVRHGAISAAAEVQDVVELLREEEGLQLNAHTPLCAVVLAGTACKRPRCLIPFLTISCVFIDIFAYVFAELFSTRIPFQDMDVLRAGASSLGGKLCWCISAVPSLLTAHLARTSFCAFTPSIVPPSARACTAQRMVPVHYRQRLKPQVHGTFSSADAPASEKYFYLVFVHYICYGDAPVPASSLLSTPTPPVHEKTAGGGCGSPTRV
ncbi:hypothetical protein FB451DRAFT_1558214 [Mycena latifolia]|nr:hypothetical protein FB451DRAFT_1558214 [Mycena latifolia]